MFKVIMAVAVLSCGMTWADECIFSVTLNDVENSVINADIKIENTLVDMESTYTKSVDIFHFPCLQITNNCSTVSVDNGDVYALATFCKRKQNEGWDFCVVYKTAQHCYHLMTNTSIAHATGDKLFFVMEEGTNRNLTGECGPGS